MWKYLKDGILVKQFEYVLMKAGSIFLYSFHLAILFFRRNILIANIIVDIVQYDIIQFSPEHWISKNQVKWLPS